MRKLKLWFLLTIKMMLRGVENTHCMLQGELSIQVMENGRRALVYSNGKPSKTTTSNVLDGRVTARSVASRQTERVVYEEDHEHCLVKVYEEYIGKLPTHAIDQTYLYSSTPQKLQAELKVEKHC